MQTPVQPQHPIPQHPRHLLDELVQPSPPKSFEPPGPLPQWSQLFPPHPKVVMLGSKSSGYVRVAAPTAATLSVELLSPRARRSAYTEAASTPSFELSTASIVDFCVEVSVSVYSTPPTQTLPESVSVSHRS